MDELSTILIKDKIEPNKKVSICPHFCLIILSICLMYPFKDEYRGCKKDENRTKTTFTLFSSNLPLTVSKTVVSVIGWW